MSRAALHYLFLPGLASPPFPNEQLLESAHWGSGKVMEVERWLFPIIKETGDKERLGAQEPHRALHGIDKQRTKCPANYSCLLKTSHLRVGMCSVAQSCPTLCDPVDCSPPGSPVHGVLQTRILEWGPCPHPGDLPDPGIEPMSPKASALQADSLLLSHWRSPMKCLLLLLLLVLLSRFSRVRLCATP